MLKLQIYLLQNEHTCNSCYLASLKFIEVNRVLCIVCCQKLGKCANEATQTAQMYGA